jgi:molecular chaperone Hsp33
MEDEIYKGRLEGLNIAFVYAKTTELANEIIVKHNCDPAAAHLLGRSVNASVMAASLLPSNQKINISWRYKGALKAIVVDAGHDGSVRGMISPAQLTNLAKDNTSLFGDVGELQVVTSDGGKILNSGTTPVALHDPVNDFGYHFSISDQIETEIVSYIGFQQNPERPVVVSQGLMIQALPSCDLSNFDIIRRRMEGAPFKKAVQRSDIVDDGFGQVVGVLVEGQDLYSGLEVKKVATPYFKCTCSQEKMAAVVRSIPIPERMNMVKRNEDVYINCQFCATKYKLTIAECIAAWNNI